MLRKALAALLASCSLLCSEAFHTSAPSAARYFCNEALFRQPNAAAAAESSCGSRRSRVGTGFSRRGAASPRLTRVSASTSDGILEGETVVVVGASGGIGRLVAQSLASTGKYKVRGLVRNLEKAKEALSSAGDGLDIELAEGNILDEESIGSAMKGASCVVACTGTTAFPTKRWAGGNTPDAVDNLAVGNMLRAAAAGGSLKLFVFLSSVGVTRADKFPFVILNAFGVLDAKAKGEAAVRRAAEEGGFAYSIVRPGEIEGDPFLVYSKDGSAMSAGALDGRSPKRMVSLQQGDAVAGRVNPTSVAETFTQVVGQASAVGKSFTVVDAPGNPPNQDTWDELFAKL